MPKTVDHNARREALLAAVWRVIARDGLERATVRTIAEETGWSTGVLAHYFADKEDILTSALQLSRERIRARWDEKLAGLNGVAALRELVLDNLPLDDERELETRFHFNYWTRLLTHEGMQAAHWRQGPELVDRLTGLVEEAQTLGEIDAGVPAADVAERLLALIDGLSLHSLLNPERLTRERQVAIAEREFEQMATRRMEERDHA
jgi:AcrR family transcriptional regulator